MPATPALGATNPEDPPTGLKTSRSEGAGTEKFTQKKEGCLQKNHKTEPGNARLGHEKR